MGLHITRRSGTRSWRQFEQDNAILTTLAENGQAETLRLFNARKLTMPQLRAAAARGQLASGTLVADIALREKLWGEAGAFRRVLPLMGKAASTRKRYEVSMLSLERKAAGVLGPDAKVADLEHVPWHELHAAWGKSGSDWNHLRRMLSRFLTCLFDDKAHPYRHRVLRKIDTSAEVERVPDITVADFWRIVEAAPDYVQAGFVTLLATGMRWGEYERAKKSHLKPRSLGVDIPGTKTPAATGTVYVAEWLWPWIERGIPAPLSYKHMRRHWLAACEAAGVEDLHMHDLRHLHGQLAIEAVDVTKVADGLRHTQLATTRRYTRTKNRKEVARAVGKAIKPKVSKPTKRASA